ncbi:hypothetical protein B0G80_9127 [Paraburkholderia sp. BL6669N2]|nr:hypothetical protein B0G80_9127 [Paraburkholderia sp. BL6669N2]
MDNFAVHRTSLCTAGLQPVPKLPTLGDAPATRACPNKKEIGRQLQISGKLEHIDIHFFSQTYQTICERKKTAGSEERGGFGCSLISREETPISTVAGRTRSMPPPCDRSAALSISQELTLICILSKTYP